tara:strand:- start:7813 stop:10149 length:2337 start_codon:yes stop_codon:yes gene_type:complete
VLGNHLLVTAPTGSGKSLPAEFALDYFHSKKKKTIYCSPIKALSNQKYYDFSNKYPHISFGLITGDIKTNPDADVLIMTTEILLNKLYQLNNDNVGGGSFSFDMDIVNELGCVVFDEIHMINDKDRGHVWENSIMLLPKHIQMIGLSATLADPEKFAFWLENRGVSMTDGKEKKEVYLAKKLDRAVPLTHYSFITTTQGFFKAVKDKDIQKEVYTVINKLFVVQDAKGKFNDEHYSRVGKVLKLFDTNKVRVKRSHVLNQVSKVLVEENMLPALCYVFSRKQLEICANELTTNLLEIDSKIPSIVRRECESIIRKLPNYAEYLDLLEYHKLVSLLEKGIGIHHSGMMPILREIVEMLFTKGYIKMLFCTESVAIGLNLPVKTTIFTDINKHDGEHFRTLLGHEFVQASGRAGRLGLDVVGNVIHLNNIFRETDRLSYKQMMSGKPQVMTSKFKLSYNLFLNLLVSGEKLSDFANKSMIFSDIDENLKEIRKSIMDTTCKLEKYSFKAPMNILNEYVQLSEEVIFASNKKRKDMCRKVLDIENEYVLINGDVSKYKEYIKTEQELISYKSQFETESSYIECGIGNVQKLLMNENFIINDVLTLKGTIASHLNEVNCLVFAGLIEDGSIMSISTKDLISLFSCFTNISIIDEPIKIQKVVEKLPIMGLVSNMFKEYEDKERWYAISSNSDYNIHYELIDYVSEWCDCTDILSCKSLLDRIEREKGIYLGEFVKALLKINNISREMEKIAELIGNVEFLSSLKQINVLTLKYVVTNQSLYV